MASGGVPGRQTGEGDTDPADLFVIGGAPIGNLFGSVSDSESDATLDAAYRFGAREIDTAPYYGHGLSEARIGSYLAANPVRAFRISTKVGRRLDPCAPAETPDNGFIHPLPFRPVFDYSAAGVRATFEASLRRLGVERVETLYLHDIGVATHGRQHTEMLELAIREALPAMRAIQAEGGAKSIGVGVNEWQVVDILLDRLGLDRVLLAGRYNLMDQSGLGLLARAHALGVDVHIGGVFASGLLVGGDKVDYEPAQAPARARRDRLTAVCDRHGVPLAAAAIAFPLAHPAISKLVLGWRSPREVSDAFAWLNARIPASLWEDLRREALIIAGAPVPA